MKLITRTFLIALAVALFAASCSDEGNVFSLEVGTCFQDDATGEITDVPIVDCSEAHDNEVYAVFDVTGDSLPAQDDMNQGCIDRFEDVIGVSFELSEIFAGSLVPTTESFSQGDREVVCYAFEINDDGSSKHVTGTVIGANR